MVSTKLYLDIRNAKPGVPSPLKIVLTRKGSSAYIPLGISFLPEHWDKTAQKVIVQPRRQLYNTYINKRKLEIDEILLSLESEKKNFGSITELKNHVVSILRSCENEYAPIPNDLLAYWGNRYADTKTGRTHDLYLATLRRVESFAGKSYDFLRLQEVNLDWLYRFDAFLSMTSPAKNARNIHFRNLRTIFNYAIDNGESAPYPFRKFDMSPEPTRKRSMRVETLRKIFSANLEPWQERYRDFFKLSFMLCGINVVDLCRLTTIEDGRIEYIRAKTKKAYSIKVEPEALEIISRYSGKSRLLNFAENVKNYRIFYNELCRGLHSIQETLNKSKDAIKIKDLTSYWARHTWATIAAELDIPHDTIAAALGHTMGNPTTAIYIDYNQKKVDDANRKVLDWVLYYIRAK